MKEVQRVVVGGVIFNKEDKVLILKRLSSEDVLPNIWELPSGKVDFNENPNNSIIREVKEETNLDTSIITPFHIFDYLIKKDDYTRHSVQINYLLKSLSNEVKLCPDEHDKFAWISKDEISDYDLTPETKSTIIKAFDKKNK